MTAGVLPDGLSAGQILISLLGETHPGMDGEALALFQDLAGVLDLHERFEVLSDGDRRAAVGAVLADITGPNDDVAGTMRRRAAWIESTPAGRKPCADPEAVADAVRAAADVIES